MTIDSFQGEYRFLSNFWKSDVTYEGDTYPTVEHAYQAAKTLDLEMREIIRDDNSPFEAKKVGQCLEMREDWEEIKISVMADLVTQKFAHKKLRRKLLATTSVDIIEGNTWGDIFWGVCDGVGENHLGNILMDVRDEIITELELEELNDTRILL